MNSPTTQYNHSMDKQDLEDDETHSRYASRSEEEGADTVSPHSRHASRSKEEQTDNDAHPTRPALIPPPPDGGYGWVCMLCAFFINFNTWGLNSTYGVFLAYYLAQTVFVGATSLDYAFVGSLSIGCALAISPLATTSVRLLGTKASLSIGAVLQTAALIGASFADQTWQLYLSQGVCYGIAMGFLFIPSVGIVPQWFAKRRSLANGIAASGSGLGGLVWSLAVGAMIPAIGLGWTFRALGIISFTLHAICIFLIKDRNKVIGSTQLAFDYKLFKRPEYLLLCFFGFFSLLGYVVLIFSLANYARTEGLDASQASIISALFNLGQALGRPPIGYFSDRIGRLNMAGSMTLLCAIFVLAIWINAHSYGVLIFYALIGGTVAGTFWAVIGPLSSEVVGLKHVPSALNLIWLFITLPSIFSEPIALEIVAGTGHYIGAQLFAGFMYIAAALCILVLRGWKINEVEVLALLKEQDDITEEEELDARKTARRGMLTRCWRLARV